jgi:hypothetical protein
VTESANEGFVKLLVQPGKDKVLGATIVSHNAGELLAPWVLAMKHKLGLNKMLGTIHAYPTMAEANKYAAGAWKQAHKPERVLRFLGALPSLASRVSRTRIVIFAKAPVPGKAKTRLIPALGEIGAARLARDDAGADRGRGAGCKAAHPGALRDAASL